MQRTFTAVPVVDPWTLDVPIAYEELSRMLNLGGTPQALSAGGSTGLASSVGTVSSSPIALPALSVLSSVERVRNMFQEESASTTTTPAASPSGPGDSLVGWDPATARGLAAMLRWVELRVDVGRRRRMRRLCVSLHRNARQSRAGSQAIPDDNVAALTHVMRLALLNPMSRYTDVLHNGLELVQQMEREERARQRERPGPLDLGPTFAAESSRPASPSFSLPSASSRETDPESEEVNNSEEEASSLSGASTASTLSLESSAAEEVHVQVGAAPGAPRIVRQYTHLSPVYVSPQTLWRQPWNREARLRRERQTHMDEVIRLRRQMSEWLHDQAWAVDNDQLNRYSTPSLLGMARELHVMAGDLQTQHDFLARVNRQLRDLEEGDEQ